MNFTFDITHYPETSIITLRGKIMSNIDIEEVAKEVIKLIDTKQHKLIFNAEELAYINSLGINFFMRVLTRTRIKNGDLIFFGVKGNVDNLFKIAKINKIYTIYDTEEEALNHFKNK